MASAPPPTLSHVLGQLSALLGRKDLSIAEFSNWYAGTANGGPTGNGLYPLTNSAGTTIQVPSPAAVSQLASQARTPQRHGAKGDGVTDDTTAINAAIQAAHDAGEDAVFFPPTPNGYLVSSPGVIENGESRNRGMIKLKPGVSLLSNGATITLSGGRHDPPALFYQAYWIDDYISDLEITGFHFYGSGDAQTYDEKDANGNFNSQFSAAMQILRGKNVRIHGNKFENWFGDGVQTGNVFQATDVWTCFNFHVYENEFKDIYREGVMFTSALGCSCHHNWFHGNGFMVAGVDVERHSAAETIRGVKVHHNLFDFRDGVGPGAFERAVPNIHYRRAVSLGFFYDGYPNNTVDGGFEGIEVHDNLVYQGCLDCWRACNVKVKDNTLINFAEDLDGVGLVNTAAIRLFDPGFTAGLTNVEVSGNTVRHPIAGHGIWAFNYADLKVHDNDVRSPGLNGIRLDYCSGLVKDNKVEDVGSPSARASGICADGGQQILLIATNVVNDTRVTDGRYTSYGVELVGSFPQVPVVIDNTCRNMFTGPIKGNQADQADFALIYGNTDGISTGWSTIRDLTVGDGTGARQITINSGAGQQNSLTFRQNGIQVAGMGFDQNGIGMALFDPVTGAYKGNWFNAYADGRTVMEQGMVVVQGTWDKPFTFGYQLYLWCNAGAKVLYWKFGSAPTNDNDGQPMAPATAA